MRVKIRGRYWNLLFKPLRGCWGQCSPATDRPREILISEKASGMTELDTIVHEILHAAFPHADDKDLDEKEPWINELGSDVARILWRLGYRRTD